MTMQYRWAVFQEKWPCISAILSMAVIATFGIGVIFVFTHGQITNPQSTYAKEIACVQAYGHYDQSTDRCHVR